MARVSIFLVIVALTVGMVGCRSAGGAEPPTKDVVDIDSWLKLDNIRNNLAGTYKLVRDLTPDDPDYDDVAGPNAHGGDGWWPIGVEFGQFRGKFYGQGNSISGLFIKSDGEEAGLFGYVGWSGVVDNVALENVVVTGAKFVGGLVGRNNGRVISSSSSGTVNGTSCVGGLVGWNDAGGEVTTSNSLLTCSVTGTENVGGLVGWNKGKVTNCSSSGSVEGTENVGGLVGWNEGPTVEYSHFTGSVQGTSCVGGLVGYNKGNVTNCSSSASVEGTENAGGLVGYNYGNTVGSCYCTGRVEGGSYSSGGLVGYNNAGSMVTDSYSFSEVTGNDYVGGLVGHNNGGIVSKSFSTGSVAGSSSIGGLVGRSDLGGTVSSSFWDRVTSGMTVSSGGTGKTTSEMQNLATFTDMATEGLAEVWEIVGVTTGQTDPNPTWNIVNGQRYPFLSWQSVG